MGSNNKSAFNATERHVGPTKKHPVHYKTVKDDAEEEDCVL